MALDHRVGDSGITERRDGGVAGGGWVGRREWVEEAWTEGMDGKSWGEIRAGAGGLEVEGLEEDGGGLRVVGMAAAAAAAAAQERRQRRRNGGGGTMVSSWLGQRVEAVVAAAVGLLPRPSLSNHLRGRALFSFFK